MRIADALHIIRRNARSIGLHRIQRGKLPPAGNCLRSKGIFAAVVHRESRGQRQIIEVDAKLGIVSAHRPGKIIRELIALLDTLNIRIRFAAKKRESRDVHRNITTARRIRIEV